MAGKPSNGSEDYRKYVKKQLDKLVPIFAAASIGDFSKDVNIPEKEDEFTEFLAGIQIILETVREKIADYERLNSELEKKVAERTAELAKSEQLLREIINNSTNLFYRHDTKHNLDFLSPQTMEFFGLKPEDAKLKWTEFLTDNPSNELGLQLTEKAIKTGKKQAPYELELKGKNGKIWVLVNERPILEKGKTVSIVGSLTDITPLKKTEIERVRRTRDLERLNALMIGRELKMAELKKRVAQLEERSKGAP